MKKLQLILIIGIAAGFILPLLAQPGNFNTSLHKTRNGKPTWYNAENGGFETLTNVPIEELGCVECHDATDANGDPYPANYEPGCVDCHATNAGSPGPVTQGDCLGCHGREQAIINNTGYSDVHRTAGMLCMDCHNTQDLHGDGTEYVSMFEDGAITTDCVDCHPNLPSSHNSNDPHGGKLHCTSCHAETNLACYNCHFESQVEAHVKRAYKQITGFQILVNREKDGKVHPATFQSLSYQGNTWIAMGPSVAHTIVKDEARVCADCHQNFGGSIPAIEEWNTNGIIQFGTWNSDDSTLSHLTGIVPLPLDYARSFKLDYIKYDGDPSDPPGPSKNWTFVSGESDGFQLLYATPLTAAQMNAIGMDTNKIILDVKSIGSGIPDAYQLDQNYPNPFNPSTTIRYSIPESEFVELKVYDALGNLIETLINREQNAGTYEVDFDASHLSSGIYFYQINSGEFSSTRKFVLMK